MFKKNGLLLVLLISVSISFSIFGNSISGDFVFDDVSVIKNRGDLKDPVNFYKLFISPYHQSTPQSGLFRPLTIFSYAANHQIGGSPAGFHIVNIVTHALNAFLVFILIQQLFKNKLLSYSTFLLFLTHPIHVEAVTSIVGRAELLALFWSLLAIHLYLKKMWLWSAVALFFGLLSKEIAIVTLPMIIYLDFAILKNRFFSSLKRFLIFTVPLGVYVVLRYVALGKYFLSDTITTIIENPLKFATFFERFFTGLKILSLYLLKLILPINLSADYSYNSIPLVNNIFNSPLAIIGLLLLTVGIYLAFNNKIPKEINVGVVIFLLPYLVISNLIKPIGTIMGERLIYFSSLGFVLLLAFGISLLAKRIGNKPVYTILATISIIYGALTIIRNKDWQDARTLFTATIKESPNSLITRTALAGVYIKDNKWDEARTQLKIAQDIYEDNSHLQNLLGVVASHDGNYKLAEQKYRKSIELNPNAINSHINLGELYSKLGKYKEAGESFEKVIQFYPSFEYVVRYCYIQIALNKPDIALDAANKYLMSSLDRSDANAVIGVAYFVKKDFNKSLPYLLEAQRLGNTAPEIEKMIEISKSMIKNPN